MINVVLDLKNVSDHPVYIPGTAKRRSFWLNSNEGVAIPYSDDTKFLNALKIYVAKDELEVSVVVAGEEGRIKISKDESLVNKVQEAAQTQKPTTDTNEMVTIAGIPTEKVGDVETEKIGLPEVKPEESEAPIKPEEEIKTEEQKTTKELVDVFSEKKEAPKKRRRRRSKKSSEVSDQTDE